MPTLYKYKLFISHAWKYGEKYKRVLTFLEAANNFSFTNYSVPEDKAFDRM
ncbi:MAG: Na+-transporting NADH:ubiquinone oxidoreductase subunit NqrB, partial [Alphaproteobacteria bacterium]